MQFALNIPLAKLVQEVDMPKGELVATMARALEDAGFSACLTSEHPAPSAEWLHNDPAAHDCVDPLTALAFVAGSTSRLKLFTNVLVLPYRNPFLTAKAAATLQIMSDNRLLLGVGIGYMQEEFDALGVSHRERGALTDEALEVIRLAWAGGSVEKRGRHFNAVGNEPRPIPGSPPPIWVGGGSDKALERAARWGDGWVPYFTVPTNDPVVRRSAVVDMDHFGEKLARLHDLRGEMGKTGPFDLSVAPPFRPQEASSANARRFLEEVDELAGHGVNWIWTSVPARTLESYLDIVRWFGEEVIAAYNKR
ncbi:MAG: TIGR03619 family F420-dependent LLM class oxidoreductase [Novosphingobium sp.]|nr:TIGR03619 family F420-dependent LLM class oxidoreductase [Novosphingobium sp.]MCP5404512.1 TIGR03619 family F420-dependent LLM class oxidoreductase [Novosphingobium sp.]